MSFYPPAFDEIYQLVVIEKTLADSRFKERIIQKSMPEDYSYLLPAASQSKMVRSEIQVQDEILFREGGDDLF